MPQKSHIFTATTNDMTHHICTLLNVAKYPQHNSLDVVDNYGAEVTAVFPWAYNSTAAEELATATEPVTLLRLSEGDHQQGCDKCTNLASPATARHLQRMDARTWQYRGIERPVPQLTGTHTRHSLRLPFLPQQLKTETIPNTYRDLLKHYWKKHQGCPAPYRKLNCEQFTIYKPTQHFTACDTPGTLLALMPVLPRLIDCPTTHGGGLS